MYLEAHTRYKYLRRLYLPWVPDVRNDLGYSWVDVGDVHIHLWCHHGRDKSAVGIHMVILKGFTRQGTRGGEEVGRGDEVWQVFDKCWMVGLCHST